MQSQGELLAPQAGMRASLNRNRVGRAGQQWRTATEKVCCVRQSVKSEFPGNSLCGSARRLAVQKVLCWEAQAGILHLRSPGVHVRVPRRQLPIHPTVALNVLVQDTAQLSAGQLLQDRSNALLIRPCCMRFQSRLEAADCDFDT